MNSIVVVLVIFLFIRPASHSVSLVATYVMANDLPLTVKRDGIDRDNAILVRNFVEAREPFHVVGILVHAVQQDHHRIVALRVVASGQPNHEAAVHVVYRDFFFGLLRPEELGDEKYRDATGRDACPMPLKALPGFHV